MSSQPDTRQRLLRSALRLFAEQGLEQVTGRDLKQAAAVRNQSALYYHFGIREYWPLAAVA